MTTTTQRDFKSFGNGYLPGLVGVEIVTVSPEAVESRMAVRREVMAPNGFLHAASVVALADTSCGYGCVAALPEGAKGFTTIELKSNFLGTAREGRLTCECIAEHLGRTTQVWSATVNGPDGKRMALFRCTQMILWPR
jgi:1,4-dihydroxy-2-naphthoyl-CoA hydrolase